MVSVPPYLGCGRDGVAVEGTGVGLGVGVGLGWAVGATGDATVAVDVGLGWVEAVAVGEGAEGLVGVAAGSSLPPQALTSSTTTMITESKAPELRRARFNISSSYATRWA